MILKSVRLIDNKIEVELEYVGKRNKTIVLDEEEMDTLNRENIAGYIQYEYGTDY